MFPFFWETPEQPPGRWHGQGEGPAHYLTDTPDGAWAEFLRHEEITRPDELAGIERAIWAVEVPENAITGVAEPTLPREALTGGTGTYEECRRECRRLRRAGTVALRAPSAALLPGAAHGWRVDGGLQPAASRDGQVIVLFGSRPDLIGWQVVESGRPSPDVLDRVRSLTA